MNWPCLLTIYLSGGTESDDKQGVAEHPASQLDDLLPWNWRPEGTAVNRAA